MLVCWSLSVAADPATDEHLRRGVELRKAGQDPAALDEFRLAYAASKGARAAAQMALAEQALGRWVVAEAHLREALASPEDGWISAHQSQLGESLSAMAAHLGWVEIRGGQAGAEVLLGEAVIATLPMSGPVRAEVGTYPIEVRAVGYYPVIKPITVTPGSLSRLEIVLRPLTPELPVPTTSASAAPSPSPSAAAALPAGVVVPVPGGLALRPLGYGLVGLSVAGVAVGVVSLLERNRAARDYNNDANCPGTSVSVQPESCQARITTVHRWEWTAGLGFVGGGLAALGAGLFGLARPASAASSARDGPRCGAGPGQWGLACGWRFLFSAA